MASFESMSIVQVVPGTSTGFYHAWKGYLARAGIPSEYYKSSRRGAILEVPRNSPRNIFVFMRSDDTGKGLAGVASRMTVLASKNGLPGSAISPTITDMHSTLGNGWYVLAMDATHLNATGLMALHITSPQTTANDDVIINVTGVDKSNNINSGLTSLPTASPSLPSGLAISTAIGQSPGGQIKANSVSDKHVYAGGKLTSCRLRVFPNAVTAGTADNSDADNAHGEVERFRITASYNPDGTLKIYKYAKEL